jgi:hypothetical protein
VFQRGKAASAAGREPGRCGVRELAPAVRGRGRGRRQEEPEGSTAWALDNLGSRCVAHSLLGRCRQVVEGRMVGRIGEELVPLFTGEVAVGDLTGSFSSTVSCSCILRPFIGRATSEPVFSASYEITSCIACVTSGPKGKTVMSGRRTWRTEPGTNCCQFRAGPGNAIAVQR